MHHIGDVTKLYVSVTRYFSDGRSAVRDLDDVTVGVQEEDLSEGDLSRDGEVLEEEHSVSLESVLDGVEVAAGEGHVVAPRQGRLDSGHPLEERLSPRLGKPRRHDVQTEPVSVEPEPLGFKGRTGNHSETEQLDVKS